MAQGMENRVVFVDVSPRGYIFHAFATGNSQTSLRLLSAFCIFARTKMLNKNKPT
jgi:hypothetical protein